MDTTLIVQISNLCFNNILKEIVAQFDRILARRNINENITNTKFKLLKLAIQSSKTFHSCLYNNN